ncbi:MAG: hypothetical protein CMB99_11865 [Flavobacteriaceae bacterium]|nr:hypothetical protein [Flavobacteriaceae bacterium]|tara:strand:+ start:186556 stop:188286 length:1731 start_codon:yes stop_codon:yes gene_type:complete
MKRLIPFVVFLIVIMFFSCAEKTNEEADIIYLNARVYTMSWEDPDLDGNPSETAPIKQGKYIPDAEAIAIKGNRIMAVGSTKELKKLQGSQTKMIDLEGYVILPGLIESHGHLNEIGEKAEAIKLQGLSADEIIELMIEKSKSVPKGEWIIASGWDEAEFANSYPDMKRLSSQTPEHPIVLIGLRGFGVMGNALAFEKAGITKSSVPEKGGKILLDKLGNLKYVLINGAKRLLFDKIPAKSLAQQTRIMKYGFDQLLSLGFTATHHLGVEKAHMEVYEDLEANGKLPMRVHAFVAARKYNMELVNTWLARGPTQNIEDFLQVTGFKGYYDGSLGSRGAKFLEPYSDKKDYTGVSGLAYGFDKDLMIKALDKGFRLAIHAIGDQANRDVLDLYEGYFKDHPDSQQLRHRIEHVQVVHPDDFKRFAPLNITASMEPAHAVEDMPWAIDRIGEERAKGAYAWRTLRQNQAKVIFNSDFTGSDPSFFYGIYCAITKKKSPNDKAYYPEQAFTKEETIRAYTTWPAYAAKQEQVSGTIEVGKWADLTIIDTDVLNASPEEILKGKVLQTMIAGKVMFKAEQ